MDCSFAALLLCFSWSNLYIDSGLSVQDRGEYFTTINRTWLVDQGSAFYGGAHVTESNDSLNPYGRLAFGYDINLGAVTWTIEASHVSSLATNKDRGVNAITLKTRWYPFRR